MGAHVSIIYYVSNTFGFLLQSSLKVMDKVNYSPELVQLDIENVISFVFLLLQDTIKSKLSALVEECRKQQESQIMLVNQDVDDDDSADVVAQLTREANQDKRVVVDEEAKKGELEEMLKSDIRKELENYMSYCEITSTEKLLQDNPTKVLQKETEECTKILSKKETPLAASIQALPVITSDGTSGNNAATTTGNTVEVPVITLTKTKINRNTPDYAGPRFDVLHWWKTIGMTVYPKLALAAPIILGKPAHNGYQERVFSIGKYCDNTLRNKMKPNNFEMRVLDTVNRFNDGIDSFQQIAKSTEPTKFVNNFFTTKNLKLILKQVDMSEDDNTEQNKVVQDEPPLDSDIVQLIEKDNPIEIYPDDDDIAGSDTEHYMDCIS
jgi:hAT family C-terminal dimerisation region